MKKIEIEITDSLYWQFKFLGKKKVKKLFQEMLEKSIGQDMENNL